MGTLRHALSPARFWRDIMRYRLAYMMLLPCLLLMLLVHFIPVAQGIYMSRLWITNQTLQEYLDAPVVGNYNFKFALDRLETSDCSKPPTENGQKMCQLIIKKKAEGRDANPITADLKNAARNTLVYAFFVNIGNISLGLLGAQLLNRKFYGQRLARTLMLLPWIVPTFAVGMLWGFMFKQEEGIINQMFVDGLNILGPHGHLTNLANNLFGKGGFFTDLFNMSPLVGPADPLGPAWLRGKMVMPAIIVPTIWRQLPFNIIMFLAALQVVPAELYEAAQMDGAGPFQRFRHITVPYLKPVLAITMMWGIIFTIFGYNIVVMMFNNPQGYAGEYGDILTPFIQRASWGKFLYGQGAAAAVLMMSGMLGFIALWYAFFRNTMTQEN